MRKEWLCAAIAATMAYAKVVRPWHLRWGATDEEIDESYPGDAIVPRPQVASTRALTINAPVEDVWPWLVQIGQGRGGFYSYTWFENLFLTHMKNADRILPQFQRLEVGEHAARCNGPLPTAPADQPTAPSGKKAGWLPPSSSKPRSGFAQT